MAYFNRTLTLLLGISMLGNPAHSAPAQCGMAISFAQPDEEGSRKTSVWQDAGLKALLFADSMKINTDGTRRSYSVDDFWGERRALNNVCNASKDRCASLSAPKNKAERERLLRGRRLLVQDAKAREWPIELMAATKIDPKIIPFKNNKPCPEVDGFLVSSTALQKPVIGDVCDITNYVDSLQVNAIVLPQGPRVNNVRQKSKFQVRGAEVGDLVAVMSGDGSVLAYAVVGDSGPPAELGEVSLALAARLLRKTSLPKNYKEVKAEWAPGKTIVVIFPKTRNQANPYLTQDRIDADASLALQNWGGADRIMSCAVHYVR